MELWEAISGRRSVRDFLPDPVSEDELKRLLEALAWAPSPLNQQPWSVVVVTEPAQKAAVRQVAEAARALVLSLGGPSWVGKYSPAFLEKAPLLLAVIYDPAKGGLGINFSQPHGALAATAAGVQNLLLAAHSLGLGGVWFTFFDPSRMRPVLGVPEWLDLVGIIALGRPAKPSPALPRKPVTVHRQRMA